MKELFTLGVCEEALVLTWDECPAEKLLELIEDD
jgi:hypothetical protein